MKRELLLVMFLVVGLSSLCFAETYTVCSSTTSDSCDYTCDGTDDNVQIQSAFDALSDGGIVALSDGIFYIDADDPVLPVSDSTFEIPSGTTLQAQQNSNLSYEIIYINNVSNVVLRGKGYVSGDRGIHDGVTGESGHGIKVSGTSSNVTIDGLSVKDCWGDGIYISADDDFVINDVHSYNNRRNNMSVTNGEYITISNSIFENANGTDPQVGIDLEPNVSDIVRHVNISGNTFIDNYRNGLSVTDGGGLTEHIKVDGNIFEGNQTSTGHVLISDTQHVAFVNNSLATTATIRGMYITGSEYIKVIGNDFHDINNTGIYMINTDYCIISQNNFLDIGSDAIKMDTSDYNTISYNVMNGVGIKTDNTYYGINQDSGINNIIAYNSIYSGSGNKNKYGVFLDDDVTTPLHNVIIGNILEGKEGELYKSYTTEDNAIFIDY